MDVTEFEKMSASDVSSMLNGKGIPERFCKAFEDNYINGKAFLRLTEPDVRKMAPPIGLTKRICMLIPKDVTVEDNAAQQARVMNMSVDDLSDYLSVELDVPTIYCEVLEDNYVNGQALLSLTESDLLEMIPSIGPVKNILSITQKQKPTTSTSQSQPTVSPSVSLPATPDPSCSSLSDTISTVSCGASTSVIPEHWRPEVEECLRSQSLTSGARNEIVRTLVSILFSKSSRPSRSDCEAIARQLILKYPFTKDDLGCGYQSWSDKMVERVRNVIKADHKKARQAGQEPTPSSPKRQKKGKFSLIRRYPISSYEVGDCATIEKHNQKILEELSKAKPRDTLLLPLLKATFGVRRMYVMNEATCVIDCLNKYPALSRAAVMDQELCLILGKADAKGAFLSEWSTKYVPAIVSYGEKSRKAAMIELISSMNSSDEASRHLTALKVLSKCFGYRQFKDNLLFIYEEYNETQTMDKVLAIDRPSPRVAAFVNNQKRQYFVITERRVLCEVPSLPLALFHTFAAYYVFNLAYPKECEKLLFFLQDYIIQHPDSVGRTSSYLATASDIKRSIN